MDYKPGKLEFPKMIQRDGEIKLEGRLMTPNTWLIFSILGLDGEWLELPVKDWENFSDFSKLCKFATKIKVVNDIVERGIKLIQDFIGNSHVEEQRQCLLQVVEYHR
ncbi:hypothetical protein SNE40_006018 [Patella caerulea]|uniref:Uncharacterized protein n=1 Tax=Patella caerulea TaxID=87958 RepID=A0AAN8K2G0_PATCE